MARIDDYRNARDLAAAALRAGDPARAALNAGYAPEEGSRHIVLPFLDRSYRLGLPGLAFADRDQPAREVPLQEQVLLLHYLQAAEHPLPEGTWIAYREIPGAAFYFEAFVKRAVNPLKGAFGANPEALRRAAAHLGSRPGGSGDVALIFHPLPRVPLQLVLWQGDEEFPAEANILFDRTAGRMLSPEDAAWLAGMLVYRLMALGR
jgi:hypothetical protein